MNQKYEILLDLIREFTQEKDILIKNSDRLCDDLGLCSFDMMVLIATLAKKGIDLDITRLKADSTVEDLYNAMEE